MEEYKWSVVYYVNTDDPMNGRICDTIDELSEFISRLDGYNHINIVRFKSSEL